MTDLFTPADEVIPTENLVESLVGEGKKYKDTEALARTVIEKELHIKRLETERAREREDVQSRETLQELVDRLSAAKTAAITPEPQAPAERVEVPKTSEDLNTIVKKEIAAQTEAQRRADNLRSVQTELIRVFGNNYSTTLEQKAKELTLGKDFLTDLAAKQPKAFLKLIVGESLTPQSVVTPPRSAVQSQPQQPVFSGARTESYYNNLKKSNPTQWRLPSVQLQRQNDAIALQAAFFDT